MTGVLIPTATEADWLSARGTGITASEIAVVLGLSPFDSPYALWHRKRGDLAAAKDTDAMRVGRHLESLVCEMFAERYPGLDVRGTGRELYASSKRPWQMATPDRLLHEAGSGLEPVAVLEAKTSFTYDEWGDEGSDEIPVHYRCQVLWQMDVMGADSACVACLFLFNRKMRVYEIAMDDDARGDLKLMRDEAELFLKSIEDGKPPEIDWLPSTGQALKRLHPSLEDTEITVPRTLAGQYRAACLAVKKAGQRKELAENRLRARLGDGRRVLDPDGSLVATRQVYEVREHFRKASTVNKLVPARTPKEA